MQKARTLAVGDRIRYDKPNKLYQIDIVYDGGNQLRAQEMLDPALGTLRPNKYLFLDGEEWVEKV